MSLGVYNVKCDAAHTYLFLTHVFNHLSKVRNQKRFNQAVVCLHFHIFQFDYNVALFISLTHFETHVLPTP
jgi:hypothetical protein